MADLVLHSEALNHVSRRQARAASRGLPTNSVSFAMSLLDPKLSLSPSTFTGLAMDVSSSNHSPADFVSSAAGELCADSAPMASDSSLTIAGVGGVGGDLLTNRATAWIPSNEVRAFLDVKVDEAKALPNGETNKAKAPPEAKLGGVLKASASVAPVLSASIANSNGRLDGDTTPWLTAGAFRACPSAPDLVYLSTGFTPIGVNARAATRRPLVGEMALR
jgi:hypothetical protein